MHYSNDLEPPLNKQGVMWSVKNSRILLFFSLSVASAIPSATISSMMPEPNMISIISSLVVCACLMVLGWRNRSIRGKLGVAAILVGVVSFLMLEGIGLTPKDGTLMATIVRFSLAIEVIMALSGIYLLVSLLGPRGS